MHPFPHCQNPRRGLETELILILVAQRKKKKTPKKPVVDRRLRFGKSSLFAEVCSANPQLDDYPSSSSSTEHNESQPHNSPPSLHASPPSPDIHSSSKPHMSADGLSPPFVHQPSGLPPPQVIFFASSHFHNFTPASILFISFTLKRYISTDYFIYLFVLTLILS